MKGKDYKSISENAALKENVFAMIVCIENKIPLFVIGKPGSSKSLAKVIVRDGMKGTVSDSSMFKQLKQVTIYFYVFFSISKYKNI